MSEQKYQHRYELQMYTTLQDKTVYGTKWFLGYFEDVSHFKGWARTHGWMSRQMPEWKYNIWEDGILIKGKENYEELKDEN
ncbi:MAG: hypothetical protein E6L03_10465 [Thaumarchaeota archaeon]|nr:MAG: hypothetical protein E6L03_10465 [Nitrososphaerota archaeon]